MFWAQFRPSLELYLHPISKKKVFLFLKTINFASVGEPIIGIVTKILVNTTFIEKITIYNFGYAYFSVYYFFNIRKIYEIHIFAVSWMCSGMMQFYIHIRYLLI